jgi:hypothetical protein
VNSPLTIKLSAHILNKIISHLGQHEDPAGSNSGPDVEVKLAYVGIDFPAEWCAAEASYDTGHALSECGIPHATVLSTGSSHLAVNWAMSHKTVQTPQTALPGDWCIERGGTGTQANDGHSYHHTTVMVSINHAAGTVRWIAGNTGGAVAYGEAALSDVCLLRPYVLNA